MSSEASASANSRAFARVGAQRQSRMARALRWLALAAIAVLALYLRWDRVAYAEFGPDQGWVVNRVYDFVTKGDFPLAGIETSVTTAQGPVESWLMAVPMLFSRDPVVATAYVGLLQVVAILGTYWFTARYFGPTVGFLAAFLYAVNPWAIHHVRKIWTPSVMSVFSVLFFASLYAAVVERRRYFFSLACALVVWLFLTHPQAAVYGPLMLVVLGVFWRRIGLGPLLLGGVLGLAVAAPYLVYESSRGFKSILLYAGIGAKGTAEVNTDSLRMMFGLGSALGYPDAIQYGFRGNWWLPDISLQNWLATGLMVLGMVSSLWAMVRIRRGWRPAGAGWEKYLLLLLLFWFPVVFAVRHSVPMYYHYFIGAYPVQFVLIALGLVAGAGALVRYLPLPAAKRQPVVATVVVVVALFIGLPQVWLMHTFVENVVNLGPTRPYGVPMVETQRAMRGLKDLYAKLGSPVVYAYGMNYRLPLDFLARPEVSLRHVDPPTEVVLPLTADRGVLVLLCSDDAGVSPMQIFHRAVLDDGPLVPQLKRLGFREHPEHAVRGPDGYVYYRLFSLDAAGLEAALAGYTKPARDLTLGNGMRLAGYRLPSRAGEGGVVELELMWQLPVDSSKQVWREHNLFVHAVKGDGSPLAQRDWELWQYLGWRAGDYMLTSHKLAVPLGESPRAVWLDFGAYERFGREPVAWAGGGPAYKVGPVAIPAATLPGQPTVAAEIEFGDGLRLSGYDLPGQAAAGGSLTVALHWQTERAPLPAYTVSVQVLDAAGRLVAQHDGQPVGGEYPTTVWVKGERVVDRHAVTLPKDLPAGEYAVHVVVYPSGGGERLPVTRGASPGASSALLAGVRLGER